MWAALRAEGMVDNPNKVQRQCREEDLRVAVRKVRTRHGTTTMSITEAEAPDVV